MRRVLTIFAVLFAAALIGAVVFGFVGMSSPVAASKADRLTVVRESNKTVLRTDSFGVIHSTNDQINDARMISFDRSPAKAFVWTELKQEGPVTKYTLSLDGHSVGKARTGGVQIKLLYGEFDPQTETPATPEHLTAGDEAYDGEGAYIVQFVTQPIEEYRQAIRNLGGKVYFYLPEQAHIVHLPDGLRSQIEHLPFVRWVGKYEPAYKMPRELASEANANRRSRQRYNVMLLERGPSMQGRTAARIVSNGGRIDNTIPEGFRIEATLTADQLIEAAHDPNVMFIDEWSAPELDMDVVRSTGGADFLEVTMGYRGEGVRGEVLDNELRQTHVDFQSGLTPLIHNSLNTEDSFNHGTSTYGIVFGRGTGNPVGRGMLPEAQGIFASLDYLTNRYVHTDRLLTSPYNAVFQSNSWGSAATLVYNPLSAELDDIAFLNDIVILQSQSNNGNQWSRPQAWAKNVVSVGGINHWGTASTDDDRWDFGSSVGPAADGRIKPDLAHFYDAILAPHRSGDMAYINAFGGTSAATPITAGHFGLFFQMWHHGLFRNTTGATVFDSRPSASTAKAVMINTAIQWDMTIAGTDTFRERQGWGRANVENLYNLRNNMLIVDEQHELQALESRSFAITPQAGLPLKVTMVYKDPMGNPSASVARVNDLSLKLISPTGVVYWGNHGLGVGGGMWSSPGGSENTVDTVENVFIETPEPGLWTIEVVASEVNQDAILETRGIDATFSLVASGIRIFDATSAPVELSGRVTNAAGRGIGGVHISVTDMNGTTVTAVTGPFGHYSFAGIKSGENYLIRASAKRHRFTPSEVLREVLEDLTGVDFVALN